VGGGGGWGGVGGGVVRGGGWGGVCGGLFDLVLDLFFQDRPVPRIFFLSGRFRPTPLLLLSGPPPSFSWFYDVPPAQPAGS